MGIVFREPAQLGKFRAVSFACTTALMLGCGFSSDRALTGGGERNAVTLIRVDGKLVLDERLISRYRFIFFSCGCSPCEYVATQLRPYSDEIPCVSSLEPEALRSFGRKVAWKGELFVDRGSRFMIEHRMVDCPRIAEVEKDGLREVSVEQVTAQLADHSKTGGGR